MGPLFADTPSGGSIAAEVPVEDVNPFLADPGADDEEYNPFLAALLAALEDDGVRSPSSSAIQSASSTYPDPLETPPDDRVNANYQRLYAAVSGLGMPLSPDEYAEAMDRASRQRAVSLQEAAKSSRRDYPYLGQSTSEDVERRYAQQVASLARQRRDYERRATESAADVLKEDRALRDALWPVLGSLTGHERFVLMLRFGLDGAGFKRLEDVGDQLGVTRQRVRQIEAKALRKMRHPSRLDRVNARIREDRTEADG